jgi:hypothetical protein
VTVVRDHTSWMLWRKAVGQPGNLAYLPDPDEIEARKAILHELQGRGLPDILITSVMVDDTPTLVVLRRMLRLYGVAETWRRCRIFIEE